MHHFSEKLRPALERVLARAASEYAAVHAADQWPLSAPVSELEDAEVVRRSLATLRYQVDVQTAFAVWEIFSEDLSAQWVDGPRNEEEVFGALEGLCNNIAAGQDYAGFSTNSQ